MLFRRGEPKVEGTPRTGNGRTGGAKPKASDCAQRLPSGTKMIKQPSRGWGRAPKSGRKGGGLFGG